MATLDELTQVRGGLWTVPDGWQQGRGAFGGLTLTTLARAAAEALGDPGRSLRALTAEIPAAVLAGPARVSAEVLRSGSGLSTVAARAEQQGGVVAHAVCTFGKARSGDLDRLDIAPPSPPPPAGLALRTDDGFAPTFTQHLEYRPLRGLPFTGAPDAVVEGYVRLRQPGPIAPQLALVALIDAWWPAAIAPATSPRPFATVSFGAQIFDRAWTLDEPLFHHAHNLVSFQGFSVEQRELWTVRGELVALNHQTLALIK